MTQDKKLYLVSAYLINEDGVVVEATEPKWVVDTHEDRVKAQVLSQYLNGNQTEQDWRVKIIQEFSFR